MNESRRFIAGIRLKTFSRRVATVEAMNGTYAVEFNHRYASSPSLVFGKRVLKRRPKVNFNKGINDISGHINGLAEDAAVFQRAPIRAGPTPSSAS